MLSLNFSVTNNVQDSGVLRKWFLIEVLKCCFNESADNNPKDKRAAVYFMRNMDVEKYFKVSLF